MPLLAGIGACGTEAPLPTGTAGNQGSAGSSVVPNGGSAGSGVATAGSGSAVAGSSSSASGSGSGGASGSGSGGASGSGSGGSGTGGANSGAAGTGTTAGQGGGGGGGTVDLKAVADSLNGFMLVGKCLSKTAESVCQTSNNGCPPENQADPALSGVITTDKTLTVGGDPNKLYTITLHIQGEVEAKRYDGGQDQSSQGASPKADGFCVGGKPNGGDFYNVYMLRTSSPKQDYFFNSLQPPGVSNHTTYGIDYTAKVKANGGSMIRMIAADRNCSMIRNCGPQENSGNVCAAPIVVQNMDPVAVSKNPSFDFTKAFDGQWVVMVVTDVTEG
jgi:hypothetical protein